MELLGFRDVLDSTYNILPLSGLATLTGQRTLTVFEEPVSGKLEQFISNTSLAKYLTLDSHD